MTSTRMAQGSGPSSTIEMGDRQYDVVLGGFLQSASRCVAPELLLDQRSEGAKPRSGRSRQAQTAGVTRVAARITTYPWLLIHFAELLD